MIQWSDIACIVFVATTINHLGLISAIEIAIQRKLWIVDCPKCLTFWCTVFYLIGSCSLITVLTVSLLASYTALWLELTEAYVDTLYLKLYDKITNQGDNITDSTGPDNGNTTGSVP